MSNLTMSMFLTKEDLEKARIEEVMDVLDGPEQECYPVTSEVINSRAFRRGRRIDRELAEMKADVDKLNGERRMYDGVRQRLGLSSPLIYWN